MNATKDHMRQSVEELSTQDFLMLGVNQIAYTRPVDEGFALHGADGSCLGVLETHNGARIAAHHYDMKLATLH